MMLLITFHCAYPIKFELMSDPQEFFDHNHVWVRAVLEPKEKMLFRKGLSWQPVDYDFEIKKIDEITEPVKSYVKSFGKQMKGFVSHAIFKIKIQASTPGVESIPDLSIAGMIEMADGAIVAFHETIHSAPHVVGFPAHQDQSVNQSTEISYAQAPINWQEVEDVNKQITVLRLAQQVWRAVCFVLRLLSSVYFMIMLIVLCIFFLLRFLWGASLFSWSITHGFLNSLILSIAATLLFGACFWVIRSIILTSLFATTLMITGVILLYQGINQQTFIARLKNVVGFICCATPLPLLVGAVMVWYGL